MFDDVIREIRRLERGVQISIEFDIDGDGFIDRVCPSSQCNVDFKILLDDWSDKVRDEVVYCPICRFEAESSEWYTPEQQEYIERAAYRYFQQRLDKAFSQSTRRFNRSQPSSAFIKVSMSYRPSPLPILIPAEASEIMCQQSTCEECGCRYSSIGAAFFCPACGHNSAASTFDAAVETVRKTLDSLSTIRQALAEATDNDTAEDSVRQICENGHVKLVAAFQRLAEASFDGLPNRSQFSPRRNVFQNLPESSDLWRSAVGDGYDDMISAPEFSKLERFFQQRHLLAHREGMVDQAYIDRSGDHRYAVGQRLIVRGNTVRDLADLVSKIADELRKRT
tara:strand:- start:2680 stop:3690 length:1011 start_codon:yes stop_codon:yes gene_type:complete